VERFAADEAETKAVGASLAAELQPGELVLLHGDLGAGKTTLVRGILEGLGWHGAVRSPTFSLLHLYPTQPPLAHADLYRVTSAEGIGLEEVLDDHIVCVEWPAAGESFWRGRGGIEVTITTEGEGRRLVIQRREG